MSIQTLKEGEEAAAPEEAPSEDKKPEAEGEK